LNGKVVLITGASSGIGAAVAREASSRGYALALTARRADRLDRLAAELRGRDGAEALVLADDLTDPDTPGRLIAATLERFGGLDVLVNNAGFGMPSLFGDTDPELLRRQLEVNLVAPVLLARLALPHLRERRGVVVNVGSLITCVPNPALGAYGTTKAGLAYFTTALRRELWHSGVRVCLVEPGPVLTEFFDGWKRRGALGYRYHPMLDAPGRWMSARPEQAARRIVRLFRRPRRRTSFPVPVAWACRSVGGLYRLLPALADRSVSAILSIYAGSDPRTRARPGS